MTNRPNSFRSLLSISCLMHFTAAARADEQHKDGLLIVRALTTSGKPQPGADAQLFSMDNDWRYWKKLGESRRCDSRGQVAFSLMPTDRGYMVKMHGRVIKKETGEPVAEQYVRGSLETPRDAVPMNRFTDPWSFIDGADTDKDGPL